MDLPNVLLDLLNSAAEPLTIVQVKKKLPGKVSPGAMATTLLELAEAGKLNALAIGKTTAYTARPPVDLCTEALAQRLPLLTQAAAPAKLKAGLPASLRPWFDEALGRLIVRGQAWWVPKGKSRLVQSRPVKFSDVASATMLNQLKKVLAEANRHRHEPRRLEDLLAWLESEGQPHATPAIPPPQPEAPEPTVEQLRLWHETDRARSSTAMIPISQTWKHYEAWASGQGMRPDTVGFRQALESLYNSGAAMLEPHERPQDLPEHERGLQIPLSLGPPGFYWSPMV